MTAQVAAAPVKMIEAARVEELLNMTELIGVIEEALANFSGGEEGGVDQPVRSVVTVNNGFLGVMPAYSRKDNALATKLVTVFPGNKDIPTHQALILLYDPANGSLLAMMDGDVITKLRTAAASAVSAKLLACKHPKVLAILGSGVQARSHLTAMTVLYNFQKIKIWNVKRESAERLSREVQVSLRLSSSSGGKQGPVVALEVCDDVKECVRDADIICTVTAASEAVLCGEWVKSGTHVCAVGACRPNMREMDDELMRSAVVYVDSRTASKQESGDIILSNADVYAEIGEVILGKKKAFAEKTTVFKSLGLAIEDAVSAKLVFDKITKTI